MHATFLALTLAGYLMAPASLLARLWDIASGPAKASAPPTLQKEGPGLDPNGVKATAPATAEAGPGLDPNGHS